MIKIEITLSREEIEEQQHCSVIAAAPELLKALKTLVEEAIKIRKPLPELPGEWVYGRASTGFKKAIEQAQAAIANAEGSNHAV